MRRSRGIWLAGAALSAMAGSAATAQVPTKAPPMRETIDENGVDLFRGVFVARQPLLTIGADQGLSYDYIYRGDVAAVSVYGGLDVSGTTYTVNFDGRADRFELTGGQYVATEAGGQTLTLSGSDYTYTSRDGTQVIFSSVYANTLTSGNTYGNAGRITAVVRPNGGNLTYNYQSGTLCDYDGDGGGGGGNIPQKPLDPRHDAGAPPSGSDGAGDSDSTDGSAGTSGSGTSGAQSCYAVERLANITSAYGYQLVFDYVIDDPDATVAHALTVWWRISNVVAKSLGGCGQPTCTWPTLDLTAGIAPVNTPSSSYTLSSTAGPSLNKVVTVKRYGETAAALSIDYNGAGKVFHVTDDLGTTTYAYSDNASANERTVTVTDAQADAKTYVFYINDTGAKVAERLKRVTDALGHTTSFTYDAVGRLKRTTYPEGNYVEQVYDSEQAGKGNRGNVIQVIRGSKTAAHTDKVVDNVSQMFEYPQICFNNNKDQFGLTITPQNCNLPRRVSDERPVDVGGYAWTEYRYNGDGSVASVRLPAPTSGAVQPETRYTYQSLPAAGGQPVTLLTTKSQCRTLDTCTGTADEQLTTYSYDVARNLLPTAVVTKAGDNSISTTTAMAWSPIGDLVSVDGPAAGTDDTTLFLYDSLRRRTGVISPDPDGPGAGSLPPRAQRVVYGSDNLVDRVEVGTVPEGATTLASFTSRQKTIYGDYQNGKPRSVKQSIDNVTYAVTHASFTLDGQLRCAAQRLNSATWGSYTDACTLQALGTDGEDRVTRWRYDDAGRVADVTTGFASDTYNPDHNVQSIDKYTYTDNGLVETATDGLNNKTTYKYDGLDRPWRTLYPDKTTADTSSATDYEELYYNDSGKVSQRRLRSGQSITYLYDSLYRLTSKDRTAVGKNDDFGFAYDNFGNVTQVTSPQWSTLTRTYDAFGRLTAENNTRLGNLAWQYDAAGRMTRQTWEDGVAVTYDYLATGEMKTVQQAGSGVPIATYAYDDLGRRTALTRGSLNSPKVVTTYGYTAGSPYLASLTHDLYGSNNDVKTTFTYTKAGQVKSAARTLDVNNVYAWTGHYNVDRPYRVNGLNQYTETGPSSNPTAVFTYDANGNLTSDGSRSYTYTADNELATFGAGTSATYDASGLLIELKDAAGTTRFHRAGGEIATELSLNGTILKRYVRGAGADEVLMAWEGSGTAGTDRHYYVADERGSIVAVTGYGGGLEQAGAYDEYGVPKAGFTARFGYTGQAWFPSVGLYDYKLRMYSATLGRFLQTDRIGYADGLNWYNYVGNDPVNATDPLGLCETTVGGVTYTWHYVNGSSSCTASADALNAAIYTYWGVNSGDILVIGDRGGSGSDGGGSLTFGGTDFAHPWGLGGPAFANNGSALQNIAYTPDRCANKTTPSLSGGAPFVVDNSQLQSIAQAKFLQHSFSLSPSGTLQSTFGGVMTSGSRVASGAAFLISTRQAVPAGRLNDRITGDLGVPTGRDVFSFAPSTNYMTVIIGPPTGMTDGMPERPVVSIYPGC